MTLSNFFFGSLNNFSDVFIKEIDKYLQSDERMVHVMRYSLLAPAKFLRPFLVTVFADRFGFPVTDSIRCAMAAEFFHVYSLVHDDLPCMDNDDVRRGQPSCHVKFGEAVALLAGDSLLTEGFLILAKIDVVAEVRCRIIRMFAEAIGYRGMLGGQLLDISDGSVYDAFTLREMHLRKTAMLFRCVCEVGAVLGGASEEQVKRAGSFGLNLGLAFQMRDDLSDLNGKDKYNAGRIMGIQVAATKMREYLKTAGESLSSLGIASDDKLFSLLNYLDDVDA